MIWQKCRLAVRAARIVLLAVGAIALVAWFGPGYLPWPITALSALTIAAGWFVTYELLRVSSRTSGSKTGAEPARYGQRSQHSRFPDVQRSRREETGSLRDSLPPAGSFPAHRRFLYFDSETGEPVFKRELPEEA